MDSFTPPAWPPYIHFRDWPVPPPPLAYIREDDYLAVTVLTSSTTSGLALRYRILQAAGGVIDGAESLDGAQQNTLRTTIYPLTEGFLLSATVSNIGGGLADSVCGVILALQKGGQASSAPHTILAQGYVSNIVGVTWPVGLPRGPATSGTSLPQAYTDSLIDLPPSSPNAQDDEFDTGTTLNASLWTWQDQLTVTASVAHSTLKLVSPNVANYRHPCILQAVPAGNWEYTAKMSTFGSGILQDVSTIGLCLVEVGTDKATGFGWQRQGGVICIPGMTVFDSLTTIANYNFQGALGTNYIPRCLYLRLRRASTTLYYEVSYDGISWLTAGSELQTTRFTTAPSHVGIMISTPNNGSIQYLDCDWFRKTA